MDEFALIRRFFDRPMKDGSVLLSIGDDGAVIVPDPGRQLICVVDTIVAGVHYPVDLSPFENLRAAQSRHLNCVHPCFPP